MAPSNLNQKDDGRGSIRGSGHSDLIKGHDNNQTRTGRQVGENRQHREPENGQVRMNDGRPRRGGRRPATGKKRDTHFLCFPLVTETSVSQLARSTAHFKRLTLVPPAALSASVANETSSEEVDVNVDGTADQTSIEDRDHQRSHDEDEKRSTESGIRSTSRLKIVAKEAFRPPGTFHLTLGVMDLSRPDQMERALKLLREMDVVGMLRQVEAINAGGDRAQSKMVDKENNEADDNMSKMEDRDLGTSSTPCLPSLVRPVSPPSTKTPEPERMRVKKIESPDQVISVSNPDTDSQPLRISLTGMSTFPNALAARVLYAKPQDPSGRLEQFAILVRQQFRQAGFITETRPLTLHATVGNLRYAVQAAKRGPNGEDREQGLTSSTTMTEGGRTKTATTKKKTARQAWKEEGQIDAREVVSLFDRFGGRVEEYYKSNNSDHDKLRDFVNSTEDAGNQSKKERETEREFKWATDITIEHVAICTLGAIKSRDPVLGLEYPPVATRALFSSVFDQEQEQEQDQGEK